MPSGTSRRKHPKEPSLAEQVVTLCDEMLHLGRAPAGAGFVVKAHLGVERRGGPNPGPVPAVGDYAHRSGPSGMMGRMGQAKDERWDALAVEFDSRAARLADLVKALDSTYDTDAFYSPDPMSVWVAYPKARTALSEDDRRWLRNKHLDEGHTAAEADAFLALLDTGNQARRQMEWTKMQWPGYVVELQPPGFSLHRIFKSPPAFVRAFDQCFNALKNWATERARQEREEKAGAGKGEAEDLQPTSCLTSLQVIGSGQVYDGWEALREILASASKRVDIEDAHINADVVALLRNAPDGVAVRVLTRKLYEDADPAFRRLAEQRSGMLEVRTTGNLHGRRIYVDEKAYILEDSIKDLASKTASSIVPVHEQTEARRLMEDFERRWRAAGVRIRPKA